MKAFSTIDLLSSRSCYLKLSKLNIYLFDIECKCHFEKFADLLTKFKKFCFLYPIAKTNITEKKKDFLKTSFSVCLYYRGAYIQIMQVYPLKSERVLKGVAK